MIMEVKKEFKTFAVATLGCKVNQFESAGMIEQLKATGWQQVNFSEVADLYLINSCTVTSRSDAETRRLIRRARRNNPDARIVATGCYAQVAADELKSMPEVDLVLGNEEKRNIIPHIILNKHQVTDLNSLKGCNFLSLTGFAEHTRAFLQIQNGCEACCSYCIVPMARGPYRSVPSDEVLTAINRLAESGYKEVVLTGIHLGEYGIDLSPRITLFELIRMIDSKKSVQRLRLGSIEPNELTEELLQLFCSSSIICPHLHIPLQSGSDSVLERMERRYDTDFYKKRLELIYKKLPDAFIAADLIAGFPGETEKEFIETCHLIESLPFSGLHIFPYSRRNGTKADLMKGHLHQSIIKERAEKLRNIGRIKNLAFKEQFINRKLSVLGQRYNKETGIMSGLSRNYLEISYPSEAELLNCEVMVQVVENHDGQLTGRLIKIDSI